MKYNIGDKVRIRKDLIINKYYSKLNFIEDMKKYLGKETIIYAINYNDGEEVGYLLKDCDLYTWTDEMLEPIVKYDEEKSSLEKALELLNMTEEEMNKEYYRRKYVPLAEEIEEKSRNRCWECNRNDDSCDVCEILFTIEYFKEKGLLKDEL